MNITIDCEKHGQNQKALPVIEGSILPGKDWPKDVSDYPRVCGKCLAASMVQPIRKCA